jgi:hypothetical protein
MKIDGRLSTLCRSRRLQLTFLLSLVIVAVVWGISGQVSRTLGQKRDSGQSEERRDLNAPQACLNRRAPEIPPGLVPKGQPILAGPIIVGCAERLGEPVRFVAYTQGTLHDGVQLCYLLEQPRERTASGGSCIPTSPALSWCTEGCPLTVVEANLAKPKGKQSKATLVTGAVYGVIKGVVLSTEPPRNYVATSPLIAVLNRSVQRRLQLPTATSLFATAIVPCVPARQEVCARVRLSGGNELSMQGRDPFGCQK